MSTVLWDETAFEEFVEREGGVKEIIFSSPELMEYWLRKYRKFVYRKEVAGKSAEDLLDWILTTLQEATEEELIYAVADVIAVLKLRKEACKEALR